MFLLLNIRQFVKGKDEEVWINIVNNAFKDYEDRRPLTLEFFETLVKSPTFDDTGMLIAEFDGKPVACIDAFIDKKMKEKKGYIRNFGVVPEYRRRSIGRQLLKKALESLKEREMNIFLVGETNFLVDLGLEQDRNVTYLTKLAIERKITLIVPEISFFEVSSFFIDFNSSGHANVFGETSLYLSFFRKFHKQENASMT